MRRRIERDYTWNAGTSGWQQTNEIHFVYDGNLVIQERDINNQPQVTYTRGKDLSGQTGSALNGAGGIGGLLARSDRAQSIPGIVTSGGVSEFGTPSYYHADGNGNITMLIATSQMIVAKYLYDPFGNTLAKCGLLADVNNYRFSSKEWNANSGLYYYLYRFYDPNLQRWVNRDPIGEWGGFNLNCFVRNTPTQFIDAFGLHWWQGLPLLNLSSCFSQEPGGNPADYASIPEPSCKACRDDPELAEAKCDHAVKTMENNYLANALAPMGLDGLGDVVITLGGMLNPYVWLGLIPNGIATGCELKNLLNIDAAANKVKKTYCKCHGNGR